MVELITVSRAARAYGSNPAIRNWCLSLVWIALLAFAAYAIANLPW